ncbi:hypothetical protein [Streptomyces roseirectus]|uniref:hypothetical protein n=1 Tax=Streptomyces roseirectus TaxID=2768066 RepID=UPI001FE57285|nr:hypothetical protein [Streptomyces roseirectus]
MRAAEVSAGDVGLALTSSSGFSSGEYEGRKCSSIWLLWSASEVRTVFERWVEC